MALVIDIETVGEEYDKIDSATQKILVDRVRRTLKEAETDPETLAKSQLGLLPLTGQIVALGALDSETNKGAVYYQNPEDPKAEEQTQEGIVLKVLGEKEMLEKFWQLVDRYHEFVTYSGRTFDFPYLMIRSAINGIRPTKDLMRGRYLYQQTSTAIHIDLYDQLTFYGSLAGGGGGLHLACRAFGITTSKSDSIDGSKIDQHFREGKCLEIAQYNARDLVATKELYQHWKQYLSF